MISWSRSKAQGHAQRAAALAQELREARSETQALRLRHDHQAELARRALTDASRAREAREDARRVLAAAVAQEQRAEEEVQHVRAESTRIVGEVQLAERERGEAAGRLRALEVRLAEERQRAEAELREAHDRAWALSAEHGSAMQRVVTEREEARAQLRGLEQLQPTLERAASARTLLGIGAVCLGLAALLLPGLLGRLAGDERAHSLEGFTALGQGAPLAIFGGLALLGLGLGTLGVLRLRALGARRTGAVATRQASRVSG